MNRNGGKSTKASNSTDNSTLKDVFKRPKGPKLGLVTEKIGKNGGHFPPPACPRAFTSHPYVLDQVTSASGYIVLREIHWDFYNERGGASRGFWHLSQIHPGNRQTGISVSPKSSKSPANRQTGFFG